MGNSTRSVIATAPTRIDLAGGTLDIWPLNLMFDNAVTINAAISIKANVHIRGLKGRQIVLKSQDQNKTVLFGSIDKVKHNHSLGLLSRLVQYFIKDNSGVEIITRSGAPAGAGLAGSSTLNIALCGALAKYTKQNIIKRKNHRYSQGYRSGPAGHTHRTTRLWRGGLWLCWRFSFSTRRDETGKNIASR